jgi:hypothetical protein
MNQKIVKQIVVGIAALVLMVLFTACSGVGTNPNGGPTNLTVSGSVVSVDSVNHSVTLSFNGQTKTIKGLTNDQVAYLQSQIGKGFSIQVTQNSDGTYSITAGTNLQADETPLANETPNSNETPGVNEPGSIDFIGKVQSVNSSSIAVSMPDGSTLSMNIVNGQTDLSHYNGGLPAVGQLIKVSALANTVNRSFTATDLKPTDSGDLKDQNTVSFHGVTTSAVGSDRVIHFAVGSRSFSYAIAPTADLKDFNNNVQSIGNNVSVKVTVLFDGTSGSAIKVDSSNGQ